MDNFIRDIKKWYHKLMGWKLTKSFFKKGKKKGKDFKTWFKQEIKK